MIQQITMQSLNRTELLDAQVSAGRPLEVSQDSALVDLNQLVLDGNYRVMLIRIHGESMAGVGISDGDMVILSERKPVSENAVIVARVNNEYVIKRSQTTYNGRRGLFLVPSNPNFEVMEVTESDNVEIIGTVMFHIRKFTAL